MLAASHFAVSKTAEELLLDGTRGENLTLTKAVLTATSIEQSASQLPSSALLEGDCWFSCSHIAPSAYFELKPMAGSIPLSVSIMTSQYIGWVPLLYHPPRY